MLAGNECWTFKPDGTQMATIWLLEMSSTRRRYGTIWEACFLPFPFHSCSFHHVPFVPFAPLPFHLPFYVMLIHDIFRVSCIQGYTWSKTSEGKMKCGNSFWIMYPWIVKAIKFEFNIPEREWRRNETKMIKFEVRTILWANSRFVQFREQIRGQVHTISWANSRFIQFRE